MLKLRQETRRIELNLRNDIVEGMIETGSPVILLHVAGCREERKHAKAKHGMAPKELCIVRFSDTLTLGTCIRGGTHHSPLFEMCLQHGFLKMMKT